MPVLRCPVMVGRDAERDALQASLAATVVGRGAAVGVIGPAGIGKSRLVDDFTRWARDDAAVFIGRCVEDGSPPALRPLTEALLSGLRAAPTLADADLDPFLPALSRVLPFWPTAPRPFDTSPIVLAEGIIRLLEAAAGRAPAILVVEDLQWADPDSLAVIEYIADNVALTGCSWWSRPGLCLALRALCSDGSPPAGPCASWCYGP